MDIVFVPMLHVSACCNATVNVRCQLYFASCWLLATFYHTWQPLQHDSGCLSATMRLIISHRVTQIQLATNMYIKSAASGQLPATVYRVELCHILHPGNSGGYTHLEPTCQS